MHESNIRVMSRREAFQYCNGTHYEKAAIISISTLYIDYEYSVYQSNLNRGIEILELCLLDADEADSFDINDVYAAEMGLLRDKDTVRITEFAECYIRMYC